MDDHISLSYAVGVEPCREKLVKLLRLAYKNANLSESIAAAGRAHAYAASNPSISQFVARIAAYVETLDSTKLEKLIDELECDVAWENPGSATDEVWPWPPPPPRTAPGRERSWRRVSSDTWEGPYDLRIERRGSSSFEVSGPGAYGSTTYLRPRMKSLEEAMKEAEAWSARIRAWPSHLYSTVRWSSA